MFLGWKFIIEFLNYIYDLDKLFKIKAILVFLILEMNSSNIKSKVYFELI